MRATFVSCFLVICPAARRDARTGTGNRNRIPCVSSKCFKERLILQNSKHFRYQGIKLRRFKNAKITEKCNSVLFKTRLGGSTREKNFAPRADIAAHRVTVGKRSTPLPAISDLRSLFLLSTWAIYCLSRHCICWKEPYPGPPSNRGNCY